MVLKKKNPTSAPWGSWVQITKSHHHSLSQLSGAFAEFGWWQVNRKWISTQKQRRGCPRHVQNQHNPSDTLGSTTLITYKEARKTPRHQVWKAQARYFYLAVLTSGFSLTLNAGGRRSSVLLPLSFLKDNITQVVWDFEACLGKHLGIKQLQTLTAYCFPHKILTSIFFSRFLFALHGCRIFQVYKLLNIKMS